MAVSLVLMLMASSPSMAFSPIFSPSSMQRSVDALVRRTDLAPTAVTTTTELSMIFNKKKKPEDDDDDLSFIETRDMTRDEMTRYNQQFENTVNQELIGMTIFSLIISLPLLYLAWVGFFADTAEIAGEL
jgi:hypothetical protein